VSRNCPKSGEFADDPDNNPLTSFMIGWANDPPARARRRRQGQAMPLHLGRVEWTQSPPLVPGGGPIDLDHLRRMTLGDQGLEREVLTMFSAQSARILGELAALPAETATHAHTLKGSARAIGAFGVADAAAGLETALSSGSDSAQPLSALGAAIAEARTAIELILRRS